MIQQAGYVPVLIGLHFSKFRRRVHTPALSRDPQASGFRGCTGHFHYPAEQLLNLPFMRRMRRSDSFVSETPQPE